MGLQLGEFVVHGVVGVLEALLRLANRPQFTDEPNRDGASVDEDDDEFL